MPTLRGLHINPSGCEPTATPQHQNGTTMNTSKAHDITLKDTLRDIRNLLAELKTMDSSNPTVQMLIEQQHKTLRNLDTIAGTMNEATRTITGLTALLVTQLAFLRTAADTSLNPTDNHYQVLRNLVKTANDTLNATRKQLNEITNA